MRNGLPDHFIKFFIMIHKNKISKGYRRLLLFSLMILVYAQNFAQAVKGWELEKMPVDLETDFALSALPPHLRNDATVYLLDPIKGYYIARQGSSGFICFVSRTEWAWAEFRNDLATPISYDAEGARSIFPVYEDVAAMRASGKFTAIQIRDSVMNRIIKGVYKAPTRAGISYMLSPVMRVYPAMPDNKNIITVSGPHYMFYAPYITNKDVGIQPGIQGPVMVNPGQYVLGEGKDPYGYIILSASETEKTKILEDGKDLLKRLAEYKPWFKIETGDGHHVMAENN
jgi:hypothetical protein